ncbi:hypothetical protein PYW07_005731 [Mythimna separata]|uniref:Uncharacterized protein n=1 Tax=Mythimna separata TaxID=271217 RepID=A0AAD7YJD1_MYTSE|nr:hypothetical protein PYW07_005731 [Mythimna separata]
MDESDLRKLLTTKNGCRVPLMRPIPDVHQMDKLPFVPIPPYNRIKDKQQSFRKILEEKATEKKVEVARPPPQRRERDRLELSQSRHIAVLRECAMKIQPPPMSKDWERKICSLVPTKLRNQYPILMEELIQESKMEWNKNLHGLAVKTIIRDEPGVSRIRYQEPHFKYKGVTENYGKMLAFRRKLADGALILHPFIRLVLESAEKMFPEYIIDLAKYRAQGAMKLNVFLTKVLEEIKRADYLVSSSWYGILVNWLKNPRCLRGLPRKKIPDFVKCATKMIAMQIQELMRRSIEAIIDGLKDPETVLILHLDLDFDGEFIYDPTLEYVNEVFHNIADTICKMSQRLMPIEQYLRMPYDYDALPVHYNDWLHRDGHKRLQNQLDAVFKPLRLYLEKLRLDYSMLYGTPAKEALLKFIEAGEKFVVCRDKIKYFQEIDSEITAVVENEYFNCATVRQLRMVDGLKRKAREFVNDLIGGIISAHLKENDSICAAFEEIKSKALKDPENAGELIEQGVYILQAKTVLVEAVKERILSQINIISNLLEMTSLTEEHVESNTRTVNWLKDIKPIFEKNAASYETHKAEMEDNLLSKIAFLNKETLEMIPYLELLDNMDDVNHTLEYLEYLRKLVHRLDDCDKLVTWINTEETTFKFPNTSYPDLEELKDYVKPFHNLVFLAHRWKRSYYTWMDGPFEYMDHVQIEFDHDFYYKEFLKISKNYRNKIKQQIAEGTEKRFQGLVDDPDVNNLPAPMKLCAQAVAELKEWRPNVQMAHIMCNPALVQRHWDEMSLIAGFDLTPTAGTTLRKIINFNLWDDIDQYEIISVAATKELALITNLNKMMAEWTDICFKTNPYKDTGINILTALDDIQCVLDDHIVKTVDKLGQAADAVAIMQRDLNALKPQLMVMAAKSAKMMQEIEVETATADKAAAQVREDQKVANVQAAAAQELKKDCEADLALALPILEDAIAALNTLKPADITIVKSMKNPPFTVKLVMAAVCVIKGIQPDKIPDPDNPGKKMLDYWGPSKRILGDMSFLESLKNFDKDNIPVPVMQKIRKEYLCHKDFKPHIIAKASTAAEGLCKWIIAMDMYDAVAKVVAPKKAKLEAAEREFAQTMAILEEKKALVARLEARLAELNEALEEANIKKKALEDEVQLCIDKLARAEKLIGGLGGERVRWTQAAENLQTLFDHVAGDILVSCAIMSYLAPYTLPIRIRMIDQWRELVIKLQMPHSEQFVFKDILGTDIKIQNWCIAGLPRDSFSVDNGVIQDNSIKWPLMIDPQGQANKWIKTMEKSNDLQLLKFTDGNYMKVMETCLEYGKPALIECILEEVDAPLDPVLLKNTFMQGGKEFIALGDNVIEYHPNFRLYMTTKLRNPHYLPEVFNKVTLINFALTKDGLEDQLLGIVVAKERPDLQEKREKLIVQSANNRAALKQVEDDILRTLQETKGDILEDETAVEVLDSSKNLAVDIMKKQEASVETEIIIEKFRLGSDPMGALIKYCERMGYLHRFNSISLGQGQGPIARAMIEKAQLEGGWLQMFLNQYEEIQYVAIKYLTGECNYGGRVTDDWDRRLIVTILDNFVNPGVVNDPNYSFCDIGPQYGLPRRCEYQDYLKHIETVPVNPPPEVFGLHMNAGITRDYSISMELTQALVLVEGGGSGGEGGNTEGILVHMAAEILSKLPKKFDLETAQKKYPVDYSESMNTVLIQEMERFNKLLNEIKVSLKDLQKAVKGLIVMSVSLDLQSNAMLLGKIPDNWRKVSYPSLKPLPSYVTDFVERLAMLNDWYENGKPSTFWLSGFFFTQAFLTGSVQNYARAEKIPIDLLIFDFEVHEVDYENIPPKSGVYVEGLFMDGGRWDRKIHAIAEQFPKILNDNMPVVWLFPKLKKDFQEGSRYKCPLYKTLERKGVLATTGHSSNFVLAFYLPSDKPSAHWIQRSVALLLQLDN